MTTDTEALSPPAGSDLVAELAYELYCLTKGGRQHAVVSKAVDTLREKDAEIARLREALKEIIAQEDKAWMPVRAFRSEHEADLDEARHEAWTAAADIARAALGQENVDG